MIDGEYRELGRFLQKTPPYGNGGGWGAGSLENNYFSVSDQFQLFRRKWLQSGWGAVAAKA